MVPWTSGKKVNSVVGCFIAARSSWLTGGFRSFIPEVNHVSLERTEKPPSQLHVSYAYCCSFSPHFCSANQPRANTNTRQPECSVGCPWRTSALSVLDFQSAGPFSYWERKCQNSYTRLWVFSFKLVLSAWGVCFCLLNESAVFFIMKHPLRFPPCFWPETYFVWY